jgi:hypothetical protein
MVDDASSSFPTLNPPDEAKLEGPEFIVRITANSAPSISKSLDIANGNSTNVASFENA